MLLNVVLRASLRWFTASLLTSSRYATFRYYHFFIVLYKSIIVCSLVLINGALFYGGRAECPKTGSQKNVAWTSVVTWFGSRVRSCLCILSPETYVYGTFKKSVFILLSHGFKSSVRQQTGFDVNTGTQIVYRYKDRLAIPLSSFS